MTTTDPFPFPHPELTPIHGKPTGPTVSKLLTQVFANAIAVPSTNGGGNHGHLGAIVPAAEYLTISNQLIAFNAPGHPGQQAPPAIGATAIQITNANRIYDLDLRTYETYNRLCQTIKQQILKAVEPTYLAILEERLIGFANRSPEELLTHLRTTYGTFNARDLEDNRATLAEPWNPDEPIEDLWTKISTVRQIATSNNLPIEEEATMPLVLTALTKSGVYSQAILEWHTKPTAQRTWNNIKDHVIRHEKARLRGLQTSQQ